MKRQTNINRNLINGQKPEFGNLDQIKVLQKEENERCEKQEYAEWYKDLSPGAKAFQAYVEVDSTMGIIQDMTKRIQAYFNCRKSIEVMIDKSCGYDKAVIKAFILQLKDGYEYMIPNLKILDDDERIEEFTELLDKINKEWNGDLKNIKAVEKLPF